MIGATNGDESRTRHVSLRGPSSPIDGRVHAVRSDLADVRLADHVIAARYADPVRLRVIEDTVAVRSGPSAEATAVSALLAGELFDAFDLTGGWAWGRCGHDGYVGWVPQAALGLVADPPTHVVTAAAAPVFAGPDIKRPVVGRRFLGSRLAADGDGDFVALHGGGFVHRRHVAAVGTVADDWVEVAARLLGAPYVWGGRSVAGIDCSGLVQVALAACGIAVPRDTDQQRAALPVIDRPDGQKGDIVFFPGHVGIMVDAANLLHANAFWMTTLIEPLSAVVGRLLPQFAEPVRGIARPMRQLSDASTTCLPATVFL